MGTDLAISPIKGRDGTQCPTGGELMNTAMNYIQKGKDNFLLLIHELGGNYQSSKLIIKELK